MTAGVQSCREFPHAKYVAGTSRMSKIAAAALPGWVVKNVIKITVKNSFHVMTIISALINNTRKIFMNREYGVLMSRMNNAGNSLRIAGMMLLLISGVIAQGVPKLDIRVDSEKVNKTELERRSGAVINYLPGDTIKYLIVASNIGDGLMTSPEVIDPIPSGVTYVAESASGEDSAITFSINQGETYMAWPPTYSVRNSKGVLIKRVATPEMVSHIKWNINKNLTPGETALLDFLVVVSK